MPTPNITFTAYQLVNGQIGQEVTDGFAGGNLQYIRLWIEFDGSVNDFTLSDIQLDGARKTTSLVQLIPQETFHVDLEALDYNTDIEVVIPAGAVDAVVGSQPNERSTFSWSWRELIDTVHINNTGPQQNLPVAQDHVVKFPAGFGMYPTEFQPEVRIVFTPMPQNFDLFAYEYNFFITTVRDEVVEWELLPVTRPDADRAFRVAREAQRRLEETDFMALQDEHSRFLSSGFTTYRNKLREIVHVFQAANTTLPAFVVWPEVPNKANHNQTSEYPGDLALWRRVGGHTNLPAVQQ